MLNMTATELEAIASESVKMLRRSLTPKAISESASTRQSQASYWLTAWDPE